MAAIPENEDATAIRVCEITEEWLEPSRFVAAVADPAAGGHALFLGTVRDHADGRPVLSLEYSAHPSALTEMEDVAREVARRHHLIALAVSHRIGPLNIGDIAVVCAASAAHRADAFAACQELIDLVKARVPIWKHEHYGDGSSIWVGLAEG